MSENTLIEKILGLQEKYEDLQKQLSDPEVISDMKKYVQLNKEYKELAPIIKAGIEYKKMMDDYDSAKEILATEKDEELREMAKEEVADIEQKIPAMEENIKPYQFVDTVLNDCLFVSVFTVGNDKFSELRSPVTEVVDSNALVTGKFVHFLNRMPDNGGTEMTDVKRLCNIGGRVIENNRFSVAFGRASVIGIFGKHVFKSKSEKSIVTQVEIKISTDRDGFFYKFGVRENAGNFRSDNRR